jgi:hypothetical protein
MHKVIHKQVLTRHSEPTPVKTIALTLHKGSEILSFGLDAQSAMCVWCLVDPTQIEYETHTLVLVWTGEAVPFRCRRFIGTALRSPIVVHCFEAAPE